MTYEEISSAIENYYNQSTTPTIEEVLALKRAAYDNSLKEDAKAGSMAVPTLAARLSELMRIAVSNHEWQMRAESIRRYYQFNRQVLGRASVLGNPFI